MEKQAKSQAKSKHYEQIIEKRFSNYKVMLYFALVSISIIFITLSALYLLSRGHVAESQSALKLHGAFYVNTFFLVLSSIGLYLTKYFFYKDAFMNYKISLGVASVAGVIFIVGQLVAWFLQWADGYHFNHNSAAYLYVISGLHGIHIVGGLIFLTAFFAKSVQQLRDFPTSIVYFTDPIARFQLQNLSLYWHFMGGIWLYLMLFFMIAK